MTGLLARKNSGKRPSGRQNKPCGNLKTVEVQANIFQRKTRRFEGVARENVFF